MTPAIDRLGRLLVAIVLAMLLPTAMARAADPASTIVIFDGSGSMWGKLTGERESKFVAAREALRQALPKLAPQTRVGLAAFGHRRKADCSDAEVMLEAEPLDVPRLMAPLDKFNPKGKGPLVAAMKEAAGQLAKETGATSLVLIHDDPDNCAQDPCAAAEEMAKANPKLAIHVISINLAKADAQRMACVPRTTGGRHFDVQDAAALVGAVDEAMKLASLEKRPAGGAPTAAAPPEPATLKPASAPHPADADGPPKLALTATLGPGGPAVVIPLAWRVSPTGSAASSPPVATSRAASLDLPLPPGSYQIEVQQGLITATEVVEVKPRGTTRHALALQAGAVRVAASLQKGSAALEQAVFAISEVPAGGGVGKTVWTGGADAPPVFLPVGTWRVSAELDRVHSERQVIVTPGAMIDANVAFGAGRLRLKATDRDGGAALDRVTFRLTEDDADSADGRREVARSAAAEPEFILPAGTYHLTARQGHVEVRERVLVNAGDDVSRTLILPLGHLALQSKLAGAAGLLDGNVAYRIERLDAKLDGLRSASARTRLALPAGRYRVESQLGTQNARVTRDVEVKAGAQTTLAFEHLSAAVQLKAATRGAPGDLSWSVKDAQDRIVWQSLQADPRAFLAAGRYKVQAESRDRNGRAEFEVKPGDNRIVEVQLE